MARVGFPLVVLVVACGEKVPADAPVPEVPTPSASAPPAGPTLEATLPGLLDAARAQTSARRAAAIVIDVASGDVVSALTRPAGVPDLLDEPVAPGAVMIALSAAIAAEEGRLRDDDPLECGDGARNYPNGVVFRDRGAFGRLSARAAVEVGSNVCASRMFDRVGGKKFSAWLAKLELVQGALPKLEGVVGANASIGQGFTARPRDIARAFAQLARGSSGAFTVASKWVFDSLASEPGGSADGAGRAGTSNLADGATYTSFVGAYPARAPRQVALVAVERPPGEVGGSRAVAQVFAAIADHKSPAR